MNFKTFCLLACTISLVSLTGCQNKVIYATPQITGQVIDRQTEQPIENIKIFLALLNRSIKLTVEI